LSDQILTLGETKIETRKNIDHEQCSADQVK